MGNELYRESGVAMLGNQRRIEVTNTDIKSQYLASECKTEIKKVRMEGGKEGGSQGGSQGGRESDYLKSANCNFSANLVRFGAWQKQRGGSEKSHVCLLEAPSLLCRRKHSSEANSGPWPRKVIRPMSPRTSLCLSLC